MNTLENLKDEFEELMLFQLENDIFDFPFQKKDFSPFVVVSYSKGLTDRAAIVQDVYSQIIEAIEHEKAFKAALSESNKQGQESIIKKAKTWLKELVS